MVSCLERSSATTPSEPGTSGESGVQDSPRPTRQMQAAPWFVYLIECRDGSIYTGIAIDVAARYAAHAAGKGARYTRAHPPARLLGCIGFPDRSSASKAEYQIKQLKPADKRRYAEAMGSRMIQLPDADNTDRVARR